MALLEDSKIGVSSHGWVLRSGKTMFTYGRLTSVVVAIAILLTACSDDEPVKAHGKIEPVKQSENEYSLSMKLTSAKSTPMPKVDVNNINQKIALEAIKMQNQTAFYRGSKYKKQVALTFDDGPDEHYTMQILDILKKEKIRATFFVLGSMVKRYPDSLHRIYREGHVVANHSWNHPVLSQLPDNAVIKQIEDTNQQVAKLIGKKPTLIRPPYGAMTKRQEQLLGKRGYKLIYWDVDTLDWNHQTPAQIMATVKKELNPGSIILQHNAGGESLKATVTVLPEIIRYLRSQGYEFTTIDKLIKTSAYTKPSPTEPVQKRDE
jgi:peptidoglycan/xylan/chitin deacetylase (PgdA/CDA1 family)